MADDGKPEDVPDDEEPEDDADMEPEMETEGEPEDVEPYDREPASRRSFVEMAREDPSLYAFGEPESELWLGDAPESHISDGKHAPLAPPPKEEKDFSDSHPPFPNERTGASQIESNPEGGATLSPRQEQVSTRKGR